MTQYMRAEISDKKLSAVIQKKRPKDHSEFVDALKHLDAMFTKVESSTEKPIQLEIDMQQMSFLLPDEIKAIVALAKKRITHSGDNEADISETNVIIKSPILQSIAKHVISELKCVTPIYVNK